MQTRVKKNNAEQEKSRACRL
jgi:hypothetical protein